VTWPGRGRLALLLTLLAVSAGVAVGSAPSGYTADGGPGRTQATTETQQAEGLTHRLTLPGVVREKPRSVTLAAVGDVMLARTVGERILSDGPGAPFAGVADELSGADVTAANLECTLSDRGEPAAKGFTFRAPPAAADALVAAGVDVVSQANNHSLDFGPDALADTEDLLAARGIAWAGAGATDAAAHRPAVLKRGGLRIAFLAYVEVPVEYGGFDTRTWEATPTTAGVAWLDVDRMRADVAAARAENDLVVVMLHFGFEGSPTPSDSQRAAAHAAIDAGAAIVIGAHPHVLQPVEEYGRGVIVYSLGNFVFDGYDNPSQESAIFEAVLDDGGVVAWRLVPVTIDEGGIPHV